MAIKAVLGTSSKAIAHSTIKPYRKHFMGKLKGNLGGGGMQRLNKLLAFQREGKEKMRAIGNVRVPKEAFINVMRK